MRVRTMTVGDLRAALTDRPDWQMVRISDTLRTTGTDRA